MKGKILRFCICAVAAILVVPNILISVSANAISELGVDITEETENTYSLLLYIKAPVRTDSLDLSIHCSEEVFVELLTIENTDAALYYSDSDSPVITEDALICEYKNTEKDIYYSACFINSFSSDNDFSFLRITLSTEKLTDNTNFTIKYTLRTSSSENTAFSVYSLKNMSPMNRITNQIYAAGDIDGNGFVNAMDARIALRYSVGLETLSPDRLPYANYNTDNTISAADARLILRASVGLEELQNHSYEISVADGKECEEAEEYIYRCTLTNISFFLVASEQKHIYSANNCTDPAKCMMCDTIVSPAAGHSFNESGYCSICNAYSDELNSTKNALIPIFEDITAFDTLANEAAAKKDFSAYIKNTEKSAICIKNAIYLCENINGMQNTAALLSKAYSLRFSAFIKCTDENGKITTNRQSYNIIAAAVIESNKLIDDAAYSIK